MKRLAVLAALALAGCFNQPKYDRPAVELPPAWKETAPRFAEDGRWWRIYDDSSLTAVIDWILCSFCTVKFFYQHTQQQLK